MTADGRSIRVLVNAATEAELNAGLSAGAEGAGLIRTELAFLDSPRWPSRQEHERMLAPLLARLDGRTATVRVLDFGGDKLPPFLGRRPAARNRAAARPPRAPSAPNWRRSPASPTARMSGCCSRSCAARRTWR